MPIEKVARGYKTAIQMDYESSFGVAPSSASGKELPVNSFGLTVSRAKNSAQTLTGRRDPVEPFDGNVETAGDVVVPVDARAFGYWLKLLFGAPTDSGSAAPYTHVFKPGDEAPSAILQCSYGTDPETYGKFAGCKVSSLQITAGSGTVSVDLDEVLPIVREACRYCADMSCEFADLSVGGARSDDGWDVDKKWNQIVVRSRKGRN